MGCLVSSRGLWRQWGALGSCSFEIPWCQSQSCTSSPVQAWWWWWWGGGWGWWWWWWRRWWWRRLWFCQYAWWSRSIHARYQSKERNTTSIVSRVVLCSKVIDALLVMSIIWFCLGYYVHAVNSAWRQSWEQAHIHDYVRLHKKLLRTDLVRQRIYHYPKYDDNVYSKLSLSQEQTNFRSCL